MGPILDLKITYVPGFIQIVYSCETNGQIIYTQFPSLIMHVMRPFAKASSEEGGGGGDADVTALESVMIEWGIEYGGRFKEERNRNKNTSKRKIYCFELN